MQYLISFFFHTTNSTKKTYDNYLVHPSYLHSRFHYHSATRKECICRSCIQTGSRNSYSRTACHRLLGKNYLGTRMFYSSFRWEGTGCCNPRYYLHIGWKDLKEDMIYNIIRFFLYQLAFLGKSTFNYLKCWFILKRFLQNWSKQFIFDSIVSACVCMPKTVCLLQLWKNSYSNSHLLDTVTTQ